MIFSNNLHILLFIDYSDEVKNLFKTFFKTLAQVEIEHRKDEMYVHTLSNIRKCIREPISYEFLEQIYLHTNTKTFMSTKYKIVVV